MDRSVIVKLAAVLSCLSLSLLAFAQPVRKPGLIVVYDSDKTVDATPYYGKRLRSRETPKKTTAVPPAPAQPPRSADLADNLPLVSHRLLPGQLEVKRLSQVTTPFFVMGMDEQSITWLLDAATALVQMNAVGFVVQADNRSDWLELEAFARGSGIQLSLLNGDGLAAMYGITTYPSVITGAGEEHE